MQCKICSLKKFRTEDRHVLKETQYDNNNNKYYLNNNNDDDDDDDDDNDGYDDDDKKKIRAWKPNE